MRALFLVGLVLLGACRRADPPSRATAPSGEDEASTEIRPNYAFLPGERPTPLATALCEALHTVPVMKKAACVGAQEPGILITPQCEEVLTAALRLGRVELDEAAVARCRAAMESAIEDCAFAKSFSTPLPDACDGILEGLTPLGRPCGSSLECAAGLQCFGVTPTAYGRCAPPAPPGTSCLTGADALTSYTRQVSAERTRPPCEGYCRLNRCVPFHAKGAACMADLNCGPGARCQKGLCVAS